MNRKIIKKSAGAFIIGLTLIFISCAKPGDATVQNGVTAYSSGKYEEALNYFKQSLTEETRYSEELIFNFIANVYAAQEDFESAAQWLEKSLAKKPDYRGFVTLGMNYQSCKNFEKAEESYKKAVSMDESKGEGWASLGILYLEEEKASDAIENLEKGAEKAPKIAVIYGYLAVAYAMNGEIEKSDAALKKAEELQCSNLGQFEEKIEKLKKVE